jgi:hypothetical protein
MLLLVLVLMLVIVQIHASHDSLRSSSLVSSITYFKSAATSMSVSECECQLSVAKLTELDTANATADVPVTPMTVQHNPAPKVTSAVLMLE